jgi:hypothetical protein
MNQTTKKPNWLGLTWHSISERPDFGRNGRRRIGVYLSDGRTHWKAVLSNENYALIGESYMWPHAKWWAVDKNWEDHRRQDGMLKAKYRRKCVVP